MNLVIEGTESGFEEELLQRSGAECNRGFHYSHSVDADEFVRLPA